MFSTLLRLLRLLRPAREPDPALRRRCEFVTTDRARRDVARQWGGRDYWKG